MPPANCSGVVTEDRAKTSSTQPTCGVEVRIVAAGFFLFLALFFSLNPKSVQLTSESGHFMMQRATRFWNNTLMNYGVKKRQPSNRTSGKLSTYHASQEIFHREHGRYGTIPELVSAGYLDKTWLCSQRQYYQLTARVLSEYEFELVAVATPNDYGWETNYFVDQSGVIRWADRKIPNRNSPALGSR